MYDSRPFGVNEGEGMLQNDKCNKRPGEVVEVLTLQRVLPKLRTEGRKGTSMRLCKCNSGGYAHDN